MTLLRAVALRGTGFALLWWALAEGDPYGWYYGLVLAALATAVSLRLLPSSRPSVPLLRRALAVLALLVWFVRRSVAGGVDVARRSASRPLALRPGVVDVPLLIPPGPAQVAVVGMVGLMPGTLSAELRGDVLSVHALDTAMPVAEQVEALQERVGRVSGWSR